jgi:hypothetical protein
LPNPVIKKRAKHYSRHERNMNASMEGFDGSTLVRRGQKKKKLETLAFVLHLSIGQIGQRFSLSFCSARRGEPPA